MKRALYLVLTSYAALLLLFTTGSIMLPLLRKKIIGGFTIGDVVIIIAVLSYGLFIYIFGLWLICDSCKNRR